MVGQCASSDKWRYARCTDALLYCCARTHFLIHSYTHTHTHMCTHTQLTHIPLPTAQVLPAGWWVGIELDSPTGKNDGEVKGVRLFRCAAQCGAVCRPSALSAAAEGKNDDDEL